MSDLDTSEHRRILLGVLDARIDRLDAEDDEPSTRHPRLGLARPSPGALLQCGGFFSFAELARALGVSTSYLSRVRAGREPMSEHMQRRMSHVACVPPELVMFALRQTDTGWRW